MAAPVAETRRPCSSAAPTTAEKHPKRHNYFHFSNTALNPAEVQMLCTHELSSQARPLLFATETHTQNLQSPGKLKEAYEILDNNYHWNEVAIHCFLPARVIQSQPLPGQMQQGSAS